MQCNRRTPGCVAMRCHALPCVALNCPDGGRGGNARQRNANRLSVSRRAGGVRLVGEGIAWLPWILTIDPVIPGFLGLTMPDAARLLTTLQRAVQAFHDTP